MSIISDERVEQLLELEKNLHALEESESCELITARTEIASLRAALAEAERERDGLREWQANALQKQDHDVADYKQVWDRAERAEVERDEKHAHIVELNNRWADDVLRCERAEAAIAEAEQAANGLGVPILGARLRRSGDYTVVDVEIGGAWVEVIRERSDAEFCHIVESTGMWSRYHSSPPQELR